MPEKLLPRDVKTRWNSTYEMLRVAIEYRAAVDMLCMNKNNNLRSYELTPQEWKTAKQLRHVLKVRLTVDRSLNKYKLTPTARARVRAQIFKDATTFFSQGRVPNLAAVIPAIDHIDAHLTTASRDEAKFSRPIRIACGLAKKTLDKYYSLTDNSISYRIAMGMCARCGTAMLSLLTYFYSSTSTTQVGIFPQDEVVGSMDHDRAQDCRKRVHEELCWEIQHKPAGRRHGCARDVRR